MRGNSLDHRALRTGLASLALWFIAIVVAGGLALPACHGPRQRSSAASNRRRPKPRDFAQVDERCATPSIPSDDARRTQAEIEKFLLSQKGINENTTAKRIKVFFHVINKGNLVSDGNISDAQIDEQMKVLNDAYKSTHFQFDPPTINRKTSPQWFTMGKDSDEEKAAKQDLRVMKKDVLNIYTANIGTYGWAAYPQELSLNPYNDGVVILFSTLPGGTSTPYNEGKTMVHEVGHWLGLFHTFEGGCTAPGDWVADTPAEAVEHRGCDSRNSCPDEPDWDPIENFMDYSSDACTRQFTAGQSERMDQMFAAYRQGP